jgi:hypothetical protein
MVEGEMSLGSLDFDTSKPCDEKGMARGRGCPERTCCALGRKQKLGECDVAGRRGLFRVEVKAMAVLEQWPAPPTGDFVVVFTPQFTLAKGDTAPLCLTLLWKLVCRNQN